MATSCNECGQQFTPARSDAKFCSSKCRTASHRKRHGDVHAPRPRRALPLVARDAGWDIHKSIDRIDRIVSDDRFARNREEVGSYLCGHLRHVRETLDRIEARLEQ